MIKLFFSLHRYYWQIYRALPCSFAEKQGILRYIRQAVGCYREENPNATIRDIRRHFGVPEKIAAAWVDESNPTTLLDKSGKRRVLFRVSACAAAILLTVTLFFSSLFLYNNIKARGSYIVIRRDAGTTQSRPE